MTATLYDDKEVVGVSRDGQITYTTESAAGVFFEKDYKIVLSWDGGSDSEHTTAGSAKVTLNKGLILTVVATQSVPKD